VFVAAVALMCDKKKESGQQETILAGTTTILVDESLTPIIEDQVAVFESDYNAKVKLLPRSEVEAIQALAKDSARIIILARNLNAAERKMFDKRKIIPKVTMFATDAIALIANREHQDTLIALDDVIRFIRGDRAGSRIRGLVFDDPNSSTVRQMNELAGVATTPSEGIYSFRTNEEVIKFVAENRDMVGVVGLNWLSQPSAEVSRYREKINILSLKAKGGTHYFYPSQNNLAEGKYPLARDLYIVNAQGYSGLGVGFASFIAGERGQRIVLKSGLLPVRIPGRKIVTRTKIETNNNN
jgi:phosphate transport system substrate-binding protein